MTKEIGDKLPGMIEKFDGKEKYYEMSNTGEVISKNRVEILAPSYIFEIGEHYVDGWFYNLDKKPKGANAILLGQELRANGTEHVSGNYCIIKPKQEFSLKTKGRAHNSH